MPQTKYLHRSAYLAVVVGLLAGIGTPALAAADTVPAADTADPAEGEVVVTGQRAAERRAVATKRAADNIQDSVSATDVGKLPDQNVAEAVRRLPGVSVANDQGEGRYVIVRGADPNLANVTLNGQTAAAPEPEGRQVKLDDIPSSLIGSVDVIKTLTPDRDANAIAGEVDINTLSAFDRSGAFLYARGAYGLYDLNDKHPYEGDATAGGRFGPGRGFGIVVSGNYSRRPIESENIQGSTNWRQVGTQVLPDDFRVRDYNLIRKRVGGVVNLDYRRGDTQLFLRTLYSQFKDNETRDQFRIELPGLRATPAGTGVFNQAGDTASFTGGRGTRFVRRREENDNTFTAQGGGKFGLGGGTKLSIEGTYSKAIKRDPLRSEFQFRTGNGLTTGIAGTIDVSNFLFRVDPTAAPNRAYDPAFYPARQVNYDRRRAAETLYQGRADLDVPLDALGSGSVIKLGGKYLRRDKVNNRDFQQFDLNGFTLAVASRDDGKYIYDGRYRLGPRVLYDAAQAYITANPARAVLNPAASLANSLSNDYDVRETIWSGYAMATVKTGDLTIIPGARIEHTDGRYQGKTITAASTATQGFNAVATRKYTDIFPGLNIRYEATDDLTVRAAATTAIGRPNYAVLVPFVLVDAGANTVTQGNPDLKPLKSRNADLSVEYYLRNKGLVSVAGFYKHIDDPIFTFGQTGVSGTFGGVALANALLTQSVNASSARIYGVEVNLQTPFSFLPAPFSDFGVSLNYTRTGGSANGVAGRVGKADNFLQSRDVATAQLYFEYQRLALRAAYSYRSRYLDVVGTARAFDQYTENHGQLDLRGSFSLVPQVVLFAEASNVTNASWRRFIGTSGQLVENERYGYSVRSGVQLAF